MSFSIFVIIIGLVISNNCVRIVQLAYTVFMLSCATCYTGHISLLKSLTKFLIPRNDICHLPDNLTRNSYIDVNRPTKRPVPIVTEHRHLDFIRDANAQVSKHCLWKWIWDSDMATRVTSSDIDHVNVAAPHSISNRVTIPWDRRRVLHVREKHIHSRVAIANTKI